MDTLSTRDQQKEKGNGLEPYCSPDGLNRLIRHSISQQQNRFFSRANGTSSRMDHTISHETSLIKFKKIETTRSIFCDYNGMKLEINNKNKAEKFTNIWILNSTLLSN